MSEKMSKQQDLLEDHLKVIAQLETEKMDLVEGKSLFLGLKRIDFMLQFAANNNKEIETASLNQQLTELITANEELNRDKVKLEIRCVELEEQQDVLKKEAEDLQETISGLKETLRNGEDVLQNIQSEKDTLKSQLEDLKVVHEKFATSGAIHDREMVEKSRLIKEQQIAINELEKSVQEKTEEIGDSLTLLDTKEKLLTEANEKVDQLAVDVASKTEEVSRLSSILNDSEVHAQAEQLRRQVEELNVKLELLSTERDDLVERLENATSELKEAEEQLKAMAEEKQGIEEEKGALESQLTKSEEDRKSTEKKTQELEAQIKDILEQNNRSNDDKNAEIQGLKADMASLKEESGERSETIDRLQDTLNDRNEELSQSQDQIRSTQNELETATTELQTLRGELDQKSELVQQLQTEALDLKAQRQDVEEELLTRTQEVNEASSNVEKLEKEALERESKIVELSAQVHELKVASANVVQVTPVQASDDSSDARELESQRDDVCNAVMNAFRDLDLDNVLLDETFDVVEAVTELANEYKQVYQKKNELETKLQSSDSASNAVEQLLQEMQLKADRIRELENELREFEKTDDKSQDAAELQQEVKDMEEILELKENRIEALERQLQETSSGANQEVPDLRQKLQNANDEVTSLRSLRESEKLELVEKLSAVESSKSALEKSNEQLNLSVQTAQSDLSQLKKSYDQLVGAQDDSVKKELIEERDKVRKKNALLTEKCKKLVAKCKQLQNQEASNLELLNSSNVVNESLKEELEGHKNEIQKLSEQLEQSNDTTSQKLHETEEKLSSALQKIQVAEQRAEALDDIQEDYKAQVEAWMKTSQAKDVELVDKEAAMAEVKLEQEVLLKNVETLQTEMDDLRANQNEKMKSIEEEKSQLMQTVQAQQETIEKLNNEAKKTSETPVIRREAVCVSVFSVEQMPKQESADKEAEEPGQGWEGEGDWGDNEGWDDDGFAGFEPEESGEKPPEDDVIESSDNKHESEGAADDDGWGDGWGDGDEDLVVPEPAKPPLPLPEQPSSILSDVSQGWKDDAWNDPELAANLRLSESIREEDEDVARSASIGTTSTSPEGFDWRAKLVEKEALIESLESDVASLKQRLNRMEESLGSEEEAKSDMEKEVDRLTEELRASQSKVDELCLKSKDQGHFLASTQLSASTCMERLDISTDMIEDYKLQIQEMTNDQQSLQLELVSTYEELEQLRPLKKVEEEFKKAQEKIEHYESYKEEWQSELSKTMDSLELAKTELGHVNNQLETAESEKTQLRDNCRKLSSRQESLDRKIELLDEENAMLKSSLDEAIETKGDLESTLQTLTFKVSEMERDLIDARKDKENKERLLEEKDEVIANMNCTLQSDSSDQRSRVADLEAQNQDLSRAIQQHLSDVESKQADIVSMSQQLATVQATLADREREVSNLRQEGLQRAAPPDITQYMGQQPDVASHEPSQPDIMPFFQPEQQGQAAAAATPFDLLPGQSFPPQQDAANWFDNLQPVEAEQLQAAPALQEIPESSKVEQLNAELQSIKEQLQATLDENDQLKHRIANKESELQQLQTMSDQIASEREAIMTQNQDKEQTIARLFSEAEVLVAEKQQFSQDMATLRASLESLQSEKESIVSQLQSEVSTKSMENDHLRSEVASLKQASENKQQPPCADAGEPPQPSVFSWDSFGADKAATEDPFSFGTVQQQPLAQEQPASSLLDPSKLSGELSELQSKYEQRCSDVDQLKTQLAEVQAQLASVQSEKSQLQEKLDSSMSRQRPSCDEQNVAEEQPSMFAWDSFGANTAPSDDPFSFGAVQQQQQPPLVQDQPASLPPVDVKLSAELSELQMKYEQSCGDLNQLKAQFADVQARLASVESEKSELQERLHQLAGDKDPFAQVSEPQTMQQPTLFSWDSFGANNAASEDPFSHGAGQHQPPPLVQEEPASALPDPSKLSEELREWQSKYDQSCSDLETLKEQLASVESDKSQLQEKLDALAKPSEEVERKMTSSGPQPTLQVNEPQYEKGVSASTYFDKAEEEADVSASSVFTTSNPPEEVAAETAVDETVAWYQAELAKYQQAITDWQAWSETQTAEFNQIKASLTQYTEAYNASVAEVSRLQAETSSSDEADKLRATIKTKDMEITDLSETLDRLKSDKEELEQEIQELSAKNTQLALDSDQGSVDDKVEFSVYEETVSNLNLVNEKYSDLERRFESFKDQSKDVEVKLQEARTRIEALERDGSAANQQTSQLETLLSEREAEKLQLEQRLETLTSEKSDVEQQMLTLSQEKSEIQTTLSQVEEQVQQLTSEVETLKTLPQEKEEAPATAASLFGQDPPSTQTDIEALKSQLETTKSELEASQKYLQDWQVWGDAKTEEYNTLMEGYNGYVEAFNHQSQELAALKEANSDLTEQIEKLQEALDVKEKDLAEVRSRVRTERDALAQSSPDAKAWEAKEAQIQELTAALQASGGKASPAVEAGGWGDDGSEDVHVPDVDAGETIAQLEKEISALRHKLTDAESAKTSLAEELNAAKVKHGKLTLKAKTLSKELEGLRGKKSKKSASPFGDDALDSFGQDVFKEQMEKAEKEVKELKKHVESLTAEKEGLLSRVDTLSAGNERFVELKERQDHEVEMMQAYQSELKRKLETLEWDMSEKDEHIATLNDQLNITAASSGDAADLLSENTRLKMEVKSLQSQVAQLTAQVEHVQLSLLAATKDTEEKVSQLADVQDKLDRVFEDNEILKNIESENARLSAECESLKLQLETVEREGGQTSPIKDYADFQDLNQRLQSEIASLKQYIEDQHRINTDLQRQLGTGAVPANIADASAELSADQLRATLEFERQLLQKLERDLTEKDGVIAKLERDLRRGDSIFPSPLEPHAGRERQDSASTDRESEIRRIFDDPDVKLLSENSRLQHDLDQSVHENRNLYRQMQTWKEQLSECGDPGDYDEDDYEAGSPSLLRAKQEQAYRSVGALQLRVEELTLEVTKVHGQFRTFVFFFQSPVFQLLEERDTLQLKLSNVMRQFERHKDSVSRASTARSTPIPWTNPAAEVLEYKQK